MVSIWPTLTSLFTFVRIISNPAMSTRPVALILLHNLIIFQLSVLTVSQETRFRSLSIMNFYKELFEDLS